MRSAVDRITLGVVLASLIVGAALLARADVPAPFRVLGYAGPGAVLFALAAGLGAVIIVRLLLDERSGAGRRHSPLR